MMLIGCSTLQNCILPIFTSVLTLVKGSQSHWGPFAPKGRNCGSKMDIVPYKNLNSLPTLAHHHSYLWDLTPKCLGCAFCLFMKFGQAIVVRVLMLNF